jgi:hypothetical protein
MALPTPPLPNPQDEIERIEKAVEQKAKDQLESAKNAAINESINLAIQLAMNGVPPPVGSTALLLANAIYAALKAPAFPTGVPTPNADPAKTFALMIAFAIIQIIWCFIKALLHPLPIIGIFFPLCDETTQILPDGEVMVVEEEVARQRADNEIKRSQAFANNQKNISDTQTKPDNPISAVAGADDLNPTKGITFEEFLARSVAGGGAESNVGSLNNPQSLSDGLGLNNNNGTTANVESPLTAINQGQGGDRGVVSVGTTNEVQANSTGVSNGELRNLFGL